jgi:hypothetical protein
MTTSSCDRTVAIESVASLPNRFSDKRGGSRDIDRMFDKINAKGMP